MQSGTAADWLGEGGADDDASWPPPDLNSTGTDPPLPTFKFVLEDGVGDWYLTTSAASRSPLSEPSLTSLLRSNPPPTSFDLEYNAPGFISGNGNGEGEVGEASFNSSGNYFDGSGVAAGSGGVKLDGNEVDGVSGGREEKEKGLPAKSLMAELKSSHKLLEDMIRRASGCVAAGSTGSSLGVSSVSCAEREPKRIARGGGFVEMSGSTRESFGLELQWSSIVDITSHINSTTISGG